MIEEDIRELYRLQHKQPPKKKKKKKAFRFILVIILLFAAEVAWIFFSNIPRQIVIAESGEILKGAWFETVSLREEYLLTAPSDGQLVLGVHSGVVVPFGETIAWVGRNRVKELSSTIAGQSKRLMILKNELKGLESELKRVNSEMVLINKLIANPNSQLNGAKQGRKRTLAELRSDYTSQQQVKSEFQASIKENQRLIAKIEQELAEWSKESGIDLIPAANAGIFSIDYDGYETQMQPSSFLTAEEKWFQRSYGLKSSGRKVKKGDIIGKIVYPYSEMLLIKTNSQQVGAVCIGDEWQFKNINGWQKLRIVQMRTLTNGTVILGFENRFNEDSFSPERLQKTFAVYRKYQGTTIPLRALFESDGKTIVKTVSGDSFKEVAVKVVAKDDEKAIVTGIQFGTAIRSR